MSFPPALGCALYYANRAPQLAYTASPGASCQNYFLASSYTGAPDAQLFSRPRRGQLIIYSPAPLFSHMTSLLLEHLMAALESLLVPRHQPQDLNNTAKLPGALPRSFSTQSTVPLCMCHPFCMMKHKKYRSQFGHVQVGSTYHFVFFLINILVVSSVLLCACPIFLCNVV